MLFETLIAARDLGRLHDIASVLVRHGLDDVVRRLGLGGLLERAGRALHWHRMEGIGKEPEVHLREALEELGPTFVKLGQILAGRSDLLPPAWTRELSRLHERATPVPYEELEAQLAEDLGGDPRQVFRDFDTTPLAAASIAQVHRAALSDGTQVVLKVRRPGIRALVEADLRLLARIAELAHEQVPELRRLRPRSLVRQIARLLRNELDLCTEARNAERLRANLADEAGLVLPRIHGHWTCERLCVMDYLAGPSVAEWIRAGKPQGVDTAVVASQGADAVLHMVFLDGFFHADPHPGNVILLADGRIGLIDFGMVGVLSDTRRREFLDLLVAITRRRVEDVVESLLAWSEGEADVDLLTQDCAAFIDRYYGLPLRELDTTALLGDLTAILRENDLFLPSDIALLLKVFVSLDGLGRQIDPDFVMAARLEPFLRRAWSRERSFGSLARRGARELGGLLVSLPADLQRLVRRARRGRLRLDIDVKRLEAFGQTIDRSANRLTMGLITASLIVGTAISLTVAGGPTVLGLPAFGLLGFGSSFALGLWLFWSILRSGRR